MDGETFRIGGERVTSVTHTLVVASDTETAAATQLAEKLRARFGRAPMTCPEPVWLRSVALHAGTTAAEQGRARTPIWLVVSEPSAPMLRALQLTSEQLALDKARFVILAHRYRQTNMLQGFGEVELSDVALVIGGDLEAATEHLMVFLKDSSDIPEGFEFRSPK